MTIETTECRGIFDRRTSTTIGIPFGCTSVVPSYTPRQRDRRAAVSEILTSLTRALDRRLDVSLMRGAVETALGQVIPARSVRLREIGSPWGRRVETAGLESIAIEVPGADPSSQGMLDVTFDAGSRLGD